MSTVLTIALAIAVGALLGYLVCAATIWRQRNQIRELKRGQAPRTRPETTKLVIWVCLAMGFAWVWCSYILAYLDHPQIAESLSQVAVTEIIGVVLAYCIKSAVENLSKNNCWPDKAPPAGDNTESE